MLNIFIATFGRSKCSWQEEKGSEMRWKKDDKLEKYEEQKKEIIEMGLQIMSLKQKLDEFGDIQQI